MCKYLKSVKKYSVPTYVYSIYVHMKHTFIIQSYLITRFSRVILLTNTPIRSYAVREFSS
jgi:hypothetical protein